DPNERTRCSGRAEGWQVAREVWRDYGFVSHEGKGKPFQLLHQPCCGARKHCAMIQQISYRLLEFDWERWAIRWRCQKVVVKIVNEGLSQHLERNHRFSAELALYPNRREGNDDWIRIRAKDEFSGVPD